MPIDTDGLSFEELLKLNQRVVARLKMLESMQAHVEMMAFNLGARISPLRPVRKNDCDNQ